MESLKNALFRTTKTAVLPEEVIQFDPQTVDREIARLFEVKPEQHLDQVQEDKPSLHVKFLLPFTEVLRQELAVLSQTGGLEAIQQRCSFLQNLHHQLCLQQRKWVQNNTKQLLQCGTVLKHYSQTLLVKLQTVLDQRKIFKQLQTNLGKKAQFVLKLKKREVLKRKLKVLKRARQKVSRLDSIRQAVSSGQIARNPQLIISVAEHTPSKESQGFMQFYFESYSELKNQIIDLLMLRTLGLLCVESTDLRVLQTLESLFAAQVKIKPGFMQQICRQNSISLLYFCIVKDQLALPQSPAMLKRPTQIGKILRQCRLKVQEDGGDRTAINRLFSKIVNNAKSFRSSVKVILHKQNKIKACRFKGMYSEFTAFLQRTKEQLSLLGRTLQQVACRFESQFSTPKQDKAEAPKRRPIFDSSS